jgi:hypothetical protein
VNRGEGTLVSVTGSGMPADSQAGSDWSSIQLDDGRDLESPDPHDRTYHLRRRISPWLRHRLCLFRSLE